MADANVTLDGAVLAANAGVLGRNAKQVGSLYRTDVAAATTGFWGARLINNFGPMQAGATSISGVTNSVGVPARRLVVIMTQPPRSVVVYEGYSDAVTGVFTFPHLAPGNYVVLDTDPSGDNVAQVFDWVVSG